MAALTGRPNLRSSEPDLWARCTRLIELRVALGHLKAAEALPDPSAPVKPPHSVWADLLGIQSYETEVVDVVRSVMRHYATPEPPPGVASA